MCLLLPCFSILWIHNLWFAAVEYLCYCPLQITYQRLLLHHHPDSYIFLGIALLDIALIYPFLVGFLLSTIAQAFGSPTTLPLERVLGWYLLELAIASAIGAVAFSFTSLSFSSSLSL